MFGYSGLEEAFPDTDCGLKPLGSRVIVQIRTPKKQTSGGLYVPQESRDTELWNTQVAKVISIGPAAFRNRDTLELWPEGAWCEPGHFVRVPKYGGDRWEVPVKNGEEALFAIFNDLDIIGRVTIDPLKVVAFL